MKFFICALIASVLVAYVIASHPVRVRGIYITQPEEGHHSNLPAIHGIKHCGGPGKVTALRVGDCSSDGRCPADGVRRATEYEFVPSQDVDSLGVRVVIFENGALVDEYEQAIASSAVQGGETYIVNAAVTIDKELQGKTLTVQYMLYHVEDGHIETCAETDFHLV